MTIVRPPAASQIAANDRSVTFIMPALNEERNLAAAVAEVRKVTTTLALPYEIVIIDDGSRDRTGAIADEFAAADPRVRVVHHETNKGLGAAYRRGVKEARCEYIMMVPGDNAHPAPGLESILAVAGTADIVVAYPLNPEVRPLARRLLSRLYTFGLNLLFFQKVPYYNGLNIYRTRLARSIEIETSSFAYSSEILIKLIKRGSSYVCAGTLIEERAEGRSKALKLGNVIGVIGAVIRLRFQA